jgi:hypothetical protein
MVDYINVLKIVDDGRVPIRIRRDVVTFAENLGSDGQVIQKLREIAAFTLRLLS